MATAYSTHSMHMRHLIYVEGIIGSGKSTVLAKCAEKYPSVLILPEQVPAWQSLVTEKGNVNLLDLYYSETKKWAFLFQMHVLKTIAERHYEARNHQEPLLAERSVHSSVKLFAHMAWKDTLLSPEEYAVISGWYDYLCKSCPVQPAYVLYINTSPEVALRRIKQRGRPEEAEISLEFLTRLKRKQERLFGKGAYTCKIITINGDQSEEEVMAQIAQHERELFLNNSSHQEGTAEPSK